MKAKKISIAIVDDHYAVREGLSYLLKSTDEIDVVLTAQNGADFLEQLNDQINKPEIVLLDIRMPVLDGIETMKLLQENQSPVRVLYLSGYAQKTQVERAAEIGAWGFLSKESGLEALCKAIRKVSNNQKSFDDVENYSNLVEYPELKNADLDCHFTKKEIEVLALICSGIDSQKIAEKLNITLSTLRTYRKNIIQKSNVKKAINLVSYAKYRCFI